MSSPFPPEAVVVADRPLAEIAEQIYLGIRAIRTAGETALGHAREVGQLLIEAKSRVPHGSWLSWLEENCSLEVSTAQIYMRVASHWKYLRSKTDRDPHFMTMRLARRYLQALPDQQDLKEAPPKAAKARRSWRATWAPTRADARGLAKDASRRAWKVEGTCAVESGGFVVVLSKGKGH